MRKKLSLTVVSAATLLATLLPSAAFAQIGATVPNWPVPSAPSGTRGGMRALGDISRGIAFVAVTPCRVVDTRGPAGTFGGPSLTAGVPRNFPIPTGPCSGIPGGADAYSLNFTVVNTEGPGFIKAYPQGTAAPVVSSLNYTGADQTVANAAIVPAGLSGGITVVAGVSGTDLIIDVNGYYTQSYNSDNYFSVTGAFSNGGVIFGHNTNTSSVGYGGNFIAESTANEAAGVRGVANGATGVTAGVRGENVSTSVNARGVLGVVISTSPGAGSAGVRGINNGTGGAGIGVYGSQDGGGYGVFGTTPDGRGVYGYSTGSGVNYGVYGRTASTAAGAAGVYGSDKLPSTGSSVRSAGVFGSSRDFVGVEGISDFAGVFGTLYNGSGGPLVRGILGYQTYGVYSSGDFGGSGAKYFVEPHPYDASKVVRYVALEGPEAGTYFRGRGRFQRGIAAIQVPEDFRLVTDAEGLTVQVTPIGEMASVAVVELGLDRIVVKASKDVEFFYLVNGERRSHKNLQPIRSGREYMPDGPAALMPEAYTPVQREMLISNGTYNPDGTPNLTTAERLGWAEIWEKREKLETFLPTSDPNLAAPEGAANRPSRQNN
jgi:hypothetical protein